LHEIRERELHASWRSKPPPGSCRELEARPSLGFTGHDGFHRIAAALFDELFGVIAQHKAGDQTPTLKDQPFTLFHLTFLRIGVPKGGPRSLAVRSRVFYGAQAGATGAFCVQFCSGFPT
jgi:hypothetical protein